MGGHREFGRSPWSCVRLRDALTRKAFLCHFSKILQHPGIHLINYDCDGETPAVGRGNGIPKIVPWTCSPLPEYVGLPIQTRIDRGGVVPSAVYVNSLPIERPARKFVIANQVL